MRIPRSNDLKSSPNRSNKKNAGFVISLELLLIIALVGLPLMVGGIMLFRKAVTVYLNQRTLMEQPDARAVIWDSSVPAKAVSPVIGYDAFDAPQIIFRDKVTEAGVVLGVRPERFTTLSRVYYTGPDCTGNVYVRSAASRHFEVSFSSQLQGINYAMGKDNILYKQGPTAFNGTLNSYWASQTSEDESPSSTPSPSCVNETISTTFTLYGLAALSRDGAGTATAIYGSCVPCTPAAHGLAAGNYTATITYSGSQVAQFAPFVGTFTITVGADPTAFTYGVVGGPSAAPSGQLQFVTTTISGVNGADFYNAVSVADLDDFTKNFKTPFRLAFPSPGTLTPLVVPVNKEGNLP